MSLSRVAPQLLASLALTSAVACIHVQQPSVYEPHEIVSLDTFRAPLRVHMKSGIVYQLTQWNYVADDSVLQARGTLYDIDRTPVSDGEFRIPLDSVALVQTERTKQLHPFGMIGLATMSVIWGSLTVACTADPKSCFGSCPTFYVDSVSRDRPLAEGFSASFARALEATDVDALGLVRPAGSNVTIRMANEAWETHAVRSVELLAVPARQANEVFATAQGQFYGVTHLESPARCAGQAGDCRRALGAQDSLTWHSVTDSTDLAAQETIDLAFALPHTGARVGLALAARQSFVSTFVLYQTMAYFGEETGTWLAALERDDSLALRAHRQVWGTIGKITVAVFDSIAGWRETGTFEEAGPIATDVQLIPLGSVAGDTVRLRLTMARGSWRIGYAALATLGAEREAIRLEPVELAPRTGKYLITYPGDEYRFTFALPRGAQSYALYIKSRGYYYEWMRGEWLAEQNRRMMALFAIDPRAALQVLAPSFKAREQAFEQNFWASRFGR
ncbi:MAG TPA: hypothetical protein VKD28_06800 [Gemmatimonadales bacterium]|nr:hypothetical protein [Gemmatimonadales bacterium]